MMPKYARSLISICLALVFCGLIFAVPVRTDSQSLGSTKEINFVFLHGMNGNSGSMQLLADCLEEQMPAYITNYESENPPVKIESAIINRNYPNNVDIETWAKNIADSINRRFAGKKNLVLIGHSMGGKTALYAVAHNIGNLADKVAMVITLNSPVRSLVNYYYVGGDTALDYWGAQMFLSGQGVLESLVNYDSAQDGLQVATQKHWLAFVSGEASPLSSQFDVSSIDALPRVIDDKIVPISCQYADGADVIYYGQYGHSDFGESEAVSSYLADQILRYVFGGNLQCSVFARAGSFEHKAGLLPGTDRWEDLVGGVLAGNGTLMHQNDSWWRWREWEDVVGPDALGGARSSFVTTQQRSSPFWSGLQESQWVNEEALQDGRVLLKTRAAPRSRIQVDWNVYQKGLMPSGLERDHYEVDLETGAQMTGVSKVAWESQDTRDIRLRIWSQAQSPFRWFRVQWRVYYKESRQRQILDELPFKIGQP